MKINFCSSSVSTAECILSDQYTKILAMSILDFVVFFHDWEAKACLFYSNIYFGAGFILKVPQYVLFAQCQDIWPSQTSLSTVFIGTTYYWTWKPFTVMVFWLTGTLFWRRHIDVKFLNANCQCCEQHKLNSIHFKCTPTDFTRNLGGPWNHNLDWSFSAMFKYPLDVSREMCFILLKVSEHIKVGIVLREIFKNS